MEQQKLPVDPEFIKGIVSSVKKHIAKHQEYRNNPEMIAQLVAEGYHKQADPEFVKKIAGIVSGVLKKIKSGEIDINKYKDYMKYMPKSN